MRILRNPFLRRKAFTALLLQAGLALGAYAQLGSSGSSSQGATVNQLPLSGRTATSSQGGVSVTQSPVPGVTTTVNTINPTVQVQGSYSGGVSGAPFSGKLSLQEALQRGLRYNLGAVGLSLAERQAQGQNRTVRSALLPNINGSLSETVQQVDLAASGVRFRSPIPGFNFPTVVGPFNFFDLRARLSQSVVDLTAWNNYHSSSEIVRANQLSLADARDLVVLAVAGSYLQVIAAAARVDSARAQLDTATALFDQTAQQRKVGLVAQVDVDRSEVQMLTQKQRLVSLQNDLAKQKINLARITGLPPTDQYEISDVAPFSASAGMTIEDALRQAIAQRSDLKAAAAQIRAAERTVSAARAERLPSLAINGDYGVIGTNPAQSHGTFSVSGTLRLPIWQGGRVEGDITQANAAAAQRRAEADDLQRQIEADVRNAFLDLQAASSQVEVAQRNVQVTKETLELTRQKFQAGVTDNVEVVQAQSSLASADLDYINSVFAHNLAKLSLARATGTLASTLPQTGHF
jgi:outer membrane protein TolC